MDVDGRVHITVNGRVKRMGRIEMNRWMVKLGGQTVEGRVDGCTGSIEGWAREI